MFTLFLSIKFLKGRVGPFAVVVAGECDAVVVVVVGLLLAAAWLLSAQDWSGVSRVHREYAETQISILLTVVFNISFCLWEFSYKSNEKVFSISINEWFA